MEALLAWVSGIPLGVVYLLILLTAVAEGLIPLVPGDIVAALLAFIVAPALAFSALAFSALARAVARAAVENAG